MKKLNERLSDVALRAVNHWGEKAQEDVAVGELAELIDVLMKRRRGQVGVEAVIDEIADAKFVIEQLSKIYGVDRVNQRLDYKIDRTSRIIDGEL